MLEGNGEDDNLKIEYKFDEKIYVISRTDGMPFDGVSEKCGAEFYGNMEKPQTLEEIIQYEVNSLTCMQIEPEVSMFNEFDWAFNEDKTLIIVLPVFLDKCNSVIVCFPEPFNGLSEVSFGSVKTLRNGNVDLKDKNILGLRK